MLSDPNVIPGLSLDLAWARYEPIRNRLPAGRAPAFQPPICWRWPRLTTAFCSTVSAC